VRPGARILAPLATGLIALTVHDATHAEGTFLNTAAYFVPLRGTEPTSPTEIPHRPGDHELLRFLLTLTHGTLAPQDARDLWEREEDQAESATASRSPASRHGHGWTPRRARTRGLSANYSAPKGARGTARPATTAPQTTRTIAVFQQAPRY
jgi:hypothetical protein